MLIQLFLSHWRRTTSAGPEINKKWFKSGFNRSGDFNAPIYKKGIVEEIILILRDLRDNTSIWVQPVWKKLEVTSL